MCDSRPLPRTCSGNLAALEGTVSKEAGVEPLLTSPEEDGMRSLSAAQTWALVDPARRVRRWLFKDTPRD